MASTNRTKEKQYAQTTLEEAVRLIQAKGMSLSQASATFKIPKGTLHNKCQGKTALNCRKGPNTLLSTEHENKIATWILNMAIIGYPVTTQDVIETVAQIFEAQGKDVKPGKKWMRLFLKRHPSVTKRHAEVISKARAAITEPMIRKWFDDLLQHLRDEDAEDVLNHSNRIFNLDETGVQLCPKSGIVLAPKNYRALYEVAAGQEKQCITVLCNFSAYGETVPPFIVYPLQRISKEVAMSVPDEWGIGRSESGWMTGATFLEYIKEIFLPWLHNNNIELPVLLLVDGHKSHLNMELHEFCVEHKIILYCLLPNTTHILQPCDVGIFGPLKAGWKAAVRKHKLKQNIQITRSNFAKIFSQAFNYSITQNIIKNAFKACGIFPFSPDAVDYTKCLSKRQLIEPDISLQEYTTAVNVIEKTVTKRTLEKYSDYRKTNKKVNSSLYKFWAKCQNKISNMMHSKSSNIDDSVQSTTESRKEDNTDEMNTEQNLEELCGTDTIIEGLLDLENMPIEIEGVNLLDNASSFENCENPNIFPDIQNDGPSSYYPPLLLLPHDPNADINTNDDFVVDKAGSHDDSTVVMNLSIVPWTDPQKTSTPVLFTKAAIPLPWYNETEKLTRKQQPSINNIKNILMMEPDLCSDKSQDVDEPSDSNLTIHNDSAAKTTTIDDLLQLPETKKCNKRKWSRSPIPLAISSKKFKLHLEKIELEKKKKAEEIKKRKIERQQRKAEKERNIMEKKAKGKKSTTVVKICKDKSIIYKSECETINKTKKTVGNHQVLKKKIKARQTQNSTNSTKKSYTENASKENNRRLSEKSDNITFGAYVVLEFQTNKRNRYYVGQVIMRDYENNFIKVKCLRKKASKFDNITYFVEPTSVDLTEVSIIAVKKILPPPEIGRRGMIFFNCNNFELNLCD